MEQATEKQIYFLKTQGIEVPNLSKQAASEMIQNIKGSVPQNSVQNVPIPVVKPGFTQPVKKTFDNKSYYVSYAKDLVVAMLASGITEFDLSQMMQKSIDVIKLAREQL